MARIGIIGSEGRMGHALARAIGDAGHTMSGGVDQGGNTANLAEADDDHELSAGDSMTFRAHLPVAYPALAAVAGAMVGAWFITPLMGVGTINQYNFSLPALVISFLGAPILLAIVNLFRRGSVR